MMLSSAQTIGNERAELASIYGRSQAQSALQKISYSKIYSRSVIQVQALTVLAQLQQHDESALNKYQIALETLLQAEKDAQQIIADIKTALDQHNAAGIVLKEQAAANEAQEAESGKGKGRQDQGPSSSMGSD